jgi:hypothetical protein
MPYSILTKGMQFCLGRAFNVLKLIVFQKGDWLRLLRANLRVDLRNRFKSQGSSQSGDIACQLAYRRMK